MAQANANPGDIIDVQALGAALHDHVTHALIKSAQLELVRLVLTAGKVLREHAVAGEITVHCVEGLIELRAFGRGHRLAAPSFAVNPDARRRPGDRRGSCRSAGWTSPLPPCA